MMCGNISIIFMEFNSYMHSQLYKITTFLIHFYLYHEHRNPVLSGCVVGGTMSAKGGPAAACIGYNT